jgi:hypothetical protein
MTKIDACQVAARPGEAGDKTELDRVFANHEHNRDCRGCRLGRKRRSGTSARCNHGDPSANQFGRQGWQPIYLTLGPAVFDHDVLAFDIAGVFQALAKCALLVRQCVVKRSGVEKSDHRHRWLLRAYGDWPRRRRAAEQRDEIASSQLIELHSIGLQDIELAMVSQELSKRIYNLSSVGESDT